MSKHDRRGFIARSIGAITGLLAAKQLPAAEQYPLLAVSGEPASRCLLTHEQRQQLVEAIKVSYSGTSMPIEIVTNVEAVDGDLVCHKRTIEFPQH